MILKLIRSFLAVLVVLPSLFPACCGLAPKVTVTGYGSSIFPESFMPSRGVIKVLAVPVSFSDYSFEEDPVPYLTDVFSGGGSQYAPSLSEYFTEASYGSLSIQPVIADTVALPSSRSSYSRKPEKLIDDVLSAAVSKQGLTLPDFDSNGDGILDGLYLIWAGPNEGYYSSWWPNSDTFYYDFRSNGIRVGSYSFLSYSMLKQDSPIQQFTAIHETGHQLGLPDLYKSGSKSGTGTDCMMDLSSGDEDPFSKMILGWLTPQQADESGWYRIKSESTDGDALLVAPEGWDGNLLSSYYLVEYVTADNNQKKQPVGSSGSVRIWRVNAATSAFTDDISRNMYKYSNDGSSSPQLLTAADKDKVWYGQGDSQSGLVLSDSSSDLLIYISRLDGHTADIYVSRNGTMPAGQPANSPLDGNEADSSGLGQTENEGSSKETEQSGAVDQDRTADGNDPGDTSAAAAEDGSQGSGTQEEESTGPENTEGSYVQEADGGSFSDSGAGTDASDITGPDTNQSGAVESSSKGQASKKTIPAAVFIVGFLIVCAILLKDPKKKKKKRRSSNRRKH